MHAKLIAKLACYGIIYNDMLLYWIQSFLTDRFQYVKIGNSFSAFHSVVSGVAQGSVLFGPILFVLFVNDICDLASLGVTIKLFADDTKLYYVFNAMSPDCLQSCLSAISAWSDQWQLKLAPLKCSVVHVNSSANGYTNHNYSYHTGE